MFALCVILVYFNCFVLLFWVVIWFGLLVVCLVLRVGGCLLSNLLDVAGCIFALDGYVELDFNVGFVLLMCCCLLVYSINCY